MATTLSAPPARAGLLEAAREPLSRIARLSLVGLVAGLLVVGVLSRLAMMLLAVTNPDATGVTSDDGFPMGQFTVAGSLNLLLFGAAVGVLGGGLYAVFRELFLGPRWFEVLSLSLGVGVVVGAVVVHYDGRDFVVLEPLWLAAGLFLLIPALYAAFVTLIGEAILRRNLLAGRWWTVAGLASWLVFPVNVVPLAVICGAWLAVTAIRRSAGGRLLPPASVWRWLGRAALTAVFVWAVIDLWRDATILS